MIKPSHLNWLEAIEHQIPLTSSPADRPLRPLERTEVVRAVLLGLSG